MSEVSRTDISYLPWHPESDEIPQMSWPKSSSAIVPAFNIPDLLDAPEDAEGAIDIIDGIVGQSKEGTRSTTIGDDGTIIITGETMDGETYRFEISVTVGANGIPTMTMTGTITGTGGFTRKAFEDVTVTGSVDVSNTVIYMNESFSANSRITEWYDFSNFNVEVDYDNGGFQQAIDGSERTVLTEYEDGTVVETTVVLNGNGKTDSDDAVEVVVTAADGTETTYTKIIVDGSDSSEEWWIDETGEKVDLPGSFNEYGEFIPDGKEPADARKVYQDYPFEDDPSDDTEVSTVEKVDTPDPEDEDQYDAYMVTLADGSEILVLVDANAAEAMGMDPMDVATTFGERVAKMPPELRALIADMPTYLKSDEEMDGAKASITGGGTDSVHMNFRMSIIVEDADVDIQNTMLHEMGHVIEDRDRRDEWLLAIDADGADVSGYAGATIAEDYAETYTLWYRVRSGQITGAEAAEIEAEFENRFAILDNSPTAIASLPGAEDGTLATTKTLENGDVVETRRELQSDGSWETTFVRVTRENNLVITYTKNDDTDDSSWERTTVRPGEDAVTIDVPNVPDDYFTGDTDPTGFIELELELELELPKVGT